MRYSLVNLILASSPDPVNVSVLLSQIDFAFMLISEIMNRKSNYCIQYNFLHMIFINILNCIFFYPCALYVWPFYTHYKWHHIPPRSFRKWKLHVFTISIVYPCPLGCHVWMTGHRNVVYRTLFGHWTNPIIIGKIREIQW